MFNSLVAKKERAVKMMDDSTCEIIDIGTVNVTGIDGMVRALKVIRYVSEARYSLISIEVLDKMLDPRTARHRYN